MVRDPQSDLSRVIPIVMFALDEKVSVQLAVYNGRARGFLPRGYFARHPGREHRDTRIT